MTWFHALARAIAAAKRSGAGLLLIPSELVLEPDDGCLFADITAAMREPVTALAPGVLIIGCVR